MEAPHGIDSNGAHPPHADPAHIETTNSPRAGHAPRIALLGGPGVGKGTQAQILKRRLAVPHFSTGEMFRDLAHTARADEPHIRRALDLIAQGKLVSDETVIELVARRLAMMDLAQGLLLDGFPRTLPQAEALDRILVGMQAPLDAVINFELDHASLIQRLSGRRTCPNCGASFHMTNRPPRVEGICDHCGATLVRRADDEPAAIEVRLQVYEQQSRPVVDYYEATQRLIRVDAGGAPEAVATFALERLAELPAIAVE